MKRADEVVLTAEQKIEATIATLRDKQKQIDTQIYLLEQQRESIDNQISNELQRLRDLTIKSDEPLRELLTRKFPEITSFDCFCDLRTQKISIYFNSCLESQLPDLKRFFKIFLDESRSKLSISFDDHAPSKQPSILVQISSAYREQLVQGLTLEEAVPKISSSRLTMR